MVVNVWHKVGLGIEIELVLGAVGLVLLLLANDAPKRGAVEIVLGHSAPTAGGLGGLAYLLRFVQTAAQVLQLPRIHAHLHHVVLRRLARCNGRVSRIGCLVAA